MKNSISILCLFCSCLFAMGQNQDIKFSGTFNNASIDEVATSIKSGTGVELYYAQSATDSLTFSGSFSQEPLNSVLKTLFQDQGINYLLEGNSVILTYNSRVITELGITSAFRRSKQQQQEEQVDKGLIFRREYLNLEGEEEDLTTKVFEIGKWSPGDADAKSTIAGYVKEQVSGDPVEGALVFIQNPFIGVSTGEDGFFSLTIPRGKHLLNFQSLNMKNTYRNVVLFSDGRLDVTMAVDIVALKSVVVSAERDANVREAELGVTRIDIKETKNLPVLLGERDIVKVATTTSGVQTIGEGAAGVNIRGGKADQNLFMVDGATVYNTSHFFGFFSIFNAEAVDNLNLYKSSIPAQFGGRLSSVFDIELKTPDKEKFTGTGGLGPVTSKLLLEAPIIKDRTSIMVGGQATYSDFVLNRVTNSSIGNTDAAFYDVVAKIHHKVNDKSNLSITGYRSFDSFQLQTDTLLSFSNFSYTNTLASLNWDYQFTDNLKADLNLSTVQYEYDINYEFLPSQAFNLAFQINEKSGRLNFNYYQNPQFTWDAGVDFKRYDLQPGHRMPVGAESLVTEAQIEDEQGTEMAGYLNAKYEPSDKLLINGGLRFTRFAALGSRTAYTYGNGEKNSIQDRTDSTFFDKGEVIQSYQGPEWRFSARYTLDPNSSVKFGFNRNQQFIHLLVNAASISPTDIWRLSSEHVRPQIADQISLGYYRNLPFKDQIIETSVEVYYKDIQDLLDFKLGADLLFNENIETAVLQGPGRSYGVELSAKKTDGWFTGWINYTYSRSQIKLEGDNPLENINEGQFFPTNYDKPHYVNLVTNYKFTRRYSFSANVVYSTGRPITYPIGKWNFKNVENIYYSERNAFRIPDYFRLDIGFNMEGNHKIKKLSHSFWSFSIYNVLGIDNVYSVFFNVDNGEVKAYKLTVFPNPIPTLTYNFTF